MKTVGSNSWRFQKKIEAQIKEGNPEASGVKKIDNCREKNVAETDLRKKSASEKRILL